MADPLRIGTEGAYPPFNFINEAGELDGLEKEFGDELCKRLEADCVWVVNDWDSMIPNLASGNYDLIIASMSITEEREKAIDFTRNYLPADPSAFAALAGAGAGVMTGKVAAQTSTTHAGYIAASEAVLVEFPSPDETIAAVRNGQVDAVFADKNFLTEAVETSGGELVFVGDEVTLGRGAGIGVRKSDAALKEKVDAVVETMRTDGSINAMIDTWLGPKATKF